jgi:hypothetical protein
MDDRPHNPENKELKPDQSYNTTEPDITPRREGGDDAIAESAPLDPNADEIVFANENTENLRPKIDTNKKENDTGNSNNNA